MHVHVWQLLGIFIVFAALLWGCRKLLSGTIQRVVYVLLVLFAVWLTLASLGILPDAGITVSG